MALPAWPRHARAEAVLRLPPEHEDGPLPLHGKLTLAAVVVADYIRARRALQRLGLQEALRVLREGRLAAAPQGPGGANGAADTVARLSRATQRSLAVLPADARCLRQSLTLVALLARHGISGELVIGARPGQDFLAHAWVEWQGLPLLESGGEEFSRLVAL